MGKPTLVGQYQGIDTPFQGRIVTPSLGREGFTQGETAPSTATTIAPAVVGRAGPFVGPGSGKEWRLIYTDVNSRLRV